MEEKNLNEKESLELITRMIQNSKRNVETNAGGPALLWGYATIITSLLIYFGWVSFNTPYIMFGWFLIPIIGGIGMIILNKKEKPKLIKTYMDKVINYIWITIGILGGVVSLSAFIVKMPILFFIGVLMCAGIILTGCVIKFKPYIYGGIAGIVLSFICLFVPPLESLLVFAGAFIVSMIIPGHMANRYTDELKTANESL